MAPADPTVELRDDDLLQVEQVGEDWIYESHPADGKGLVLIHTREVEDWPAELCNYFAIRLIDLDEIARIPEFYARGYKLIVYKEHPYLQRLIHVLAECVEF